MDEKQDAKQNRRNFLLQGLLAGGAIALGAGINSAFSEEKEEESGEKVKLLSPEGELVEVDKSHVAACCKPASREESRKGIPFRKFVMVVDLSKCRNARKCKDVCDNFHHLPPERPYIKILKMQDNEKSSPYWMPKKCFHCDNPACVKVCPVDATYKRSDGIVLIDNQRCVGCRFCMAACPYSARVFNWGEPKAVKEAEGKEYSPETSVPSRVGTVEKCDFCPDIIRQGKLPHCVPACPNGVLYFGDINEDTVTNGSETVRFSELIKDKAGYRYMEELGAQPSVYYLPASNRLFPFKEEGKETDY